MASEKQEFGHVKSSDGSEQGRAFLEELLDRLGMPSKVVAEVSGENAVLKVTGKGRELARQPDLQAAVSILTAQATNRGGNRTRSMVDFDGRFVDRQGILARVAKDVAGSVAVTGRRCVLSGLSSAERRVVHDTLKGDNRVVTRSEGEDAERRLLIERA